jgi:hypothetical protein
VQIVDKQINIIKQEINPHLEKEHNSIFKKYVKEWKWLYEVKTDWKWWWWASNKWWENKPCEECNILWHKYEFEI